MASITSKTVGRLAEHRSDPSVSLFLPTHRSGPEIEQDRIRLKNLVSKAREQLGDAGMRRPAIDELLSPAADRIDDHGFWQHQADGLAFFLSAEVNRAFRLPVPIAEVAVVADHFYLSPLLPAVARDRFLVLALSRGSVRLFEATRSGIAEIAIDAPTSIDDADWFADRESQLQQHATGVGGESAAFHAHDPHEKEAADLRRFLTAVARAVSRLPSSDSPVVVAAVDEVRSAYEALAEHPITEGHISGNPDRLSSSELHDRALDVIEDELAGREALRLEALTEARGAGRAALGLTETLDASSAGRVAEMLVDSGAVPWNGRNVNGAAGVEAPTLDDVERAVISTIRHGGDAWMVSGLPDGAAVAAILRY